MFHNVYEGRIGNYLNSTKKITREFLNTILYRTSEVEDYFHEEAVKLDEGITEVFGDEYPSFMQVQRPNESKRNEQYRKEYFESTGNPVKGYLGQIEKQVDKVFSSPDCKIKFSKNSKLDPKDSLEQYLTKEYYNGDNFFNAFRETIKNKVLTSPNSVLAVIPNERTGENSYPKPYYIVADPENVLFYKANEICVILSELKEDVINGETIEYAFGDIFYIFDKTNYVIAKHTGYFEDGSTKRYSVNTINGEFRKHNCDFMPCKKIGRKILKQTENGFELRTSDLEDSLVFLRNGIMNHMDLIVEHNHHVASQEWAIGTVDCTDCRGTGKVAPENPKAGAKPVKCKTCGGGGKTQGLTGSGLDKIVIPYRINELGRSESAPSTVGGFIERPETGSRLFDAAFEKNMLRALQPFGLEHLMKVPLNQSGASKDYDMQEGYTFVLAMSNHIESLFGMTVNAISNMRYQAAIPEYQEAEKPTLVMPKTFNLSSSESLSTKLKDTVTYNLPNVLIAKYTEELLEKESGIGSEELLYYQVRKRLDPLPTSNLAEKSTSRNFLSNVKYILTTNIDGILAEAMAIQKDFLYLSYEMQKEKVYEIAERYLKEVGSNIKIDEIKKTSTRSNNAPSNIE